MSLQSPLPRALPPLQKGDERLDEINTDERKNVTESQTKIGKINLSDLMPTHATQQ